MIPKADVLAWRNSHNVKMTELEACQDLLLRRLMIEVGGHPYLGKYTALTGGTTLHQAILPKPLRYSEDLDLLMRVPTGTNLSDFYSAWRNEGLIYLTSQKGSDQG